MNSIPAGYKQTEVGVIPEDWIVRTLESVSVISRLAGAEYTSVWEETPDGEITALRGFNIGKGKIIEKDFVHISNELSLKLKRSRLCKDDVVYPCVGSIGNAAVINEDCKYHIQQNIARITPNAAAISSRYLANYLMSFLGEREVLRFNASSSQPSVLVSSLRQYRVPLPPTKAEQEAIAEALSDTDALIESLEQLITKKRHIKQGAMQELLTGKKRLPGFSGEWEECSFGDIFNYQSTATNSRSDLTTEGDIYYIHYGDIHTKFHSHLDFSHTKPPMIERRLCKNATLLQNGDWVMADASEDFDGVGKSIEITGLDSDMKAVAGLHTFLLREKTPTFAPGFKGHLGNLHSLHQEFLRVATGLKVFGVSKTALKSLSLPVPPIPEQTAIAIVLSDMDAEITSLETKLAKTRQLKQCIMHNLLTGRIRLV